MAGQVLTSSSFKGAALGLGLRSSRPARQSVRTCAAVRKVNTYDPSWSKGIGSIGYFGEDREGSLAKKSYLKKIEEKKLLSSVEELGLLSKLEAAGITLSKVEKWGLLSTAEKYGLLSVLENVLVEDPSKIVSYSIPFFVASILAVVLIPGDNLAESILRYGTATLLGGTSFAIFVGGFVVAAIQEEE